MLTHGHVEPCTEVETTWKCETGISESELCLENDCKREVFINRYRKIYDMREEDGVKLRS